MDPNVKFLYKTMQERDPRKRRVKPVAPDLIQVNFDGFDDSEDDSDFDINQLSDGSTTSPIRKKSKNSGSTDEGKEESDDDDWEDVSGTDGDDGEGENQQVQHNGKEIADKIITEEKDDEEDEESTSMESESESEEDDTEDSGDVSDAGDRDGDDENPNEKNGSDEELQSPPIRSLGNIWNSIDSDEDDEDYIPRKKQKKKTQQTQKSKPNIKNCKENKETEECITQQVSSEPQKQKRIKVIVCCVCLSDKCSGIEEIVECDCCGVSVHEGCYGIGESHSVASTESSASTEPWFCDACKANAKPMCELCPNAGGVFKETDTGKWVHLVCALYTPGVAFGDVDRLNSVTLFEMPYTKWGAKECLLCEDPRFSQTGVCINCDAGMCKAYFHVTCAQREGLLAELSPEDVMEVADPFFAYCKMHADKFVSKMKRRNWLAIQSHYKSYAPSPITDEKEKARFQRKLSHHRDKYRLAKQRKPPAWVPTQKLVRHLHTSPTALRSFLRKAELMGVITQVENTPMETKDTHKKSGQVTFTSDFITYFMERNLKVDSLKAKLVELKGQNKRLHNQERIARTQYEKINSRVKSLRQTSTNIRMEGESLLGMLADIYGKPLPKVPDVFMGKKKKTENKGETNVTSAQLINKCGVCHQTSDQHFLALCDQCKKHYHLGCLDPPLTRMPKKTKLFGWECSFCVKSSSGDSVKSHPNCNEPRQLRETIRGPDKFFLLSHIQESLSSVRKKSIQSQKSKKRRQASLMRLSHQGKSVRKPKGKWKVNPSKPHIQKKKDETLDQGLEPLPSHTASTSDIVAGMSLTQSEIDALDIMCVVCNQHGEASDTVRCDDCMLCYHLKCLTPPMKKSPKVRGYAWHCEACDMMSSDEEISGRRSQRYEVTNPTSTTEGRPTGRSASDGVVFDIDVSSDEM